MQSEDTLGEKETEEKISQYLTAIKERFGYIAAFVISEHSRRYYTPKGISKVLDPMADPHDIWYKIFIDSGKLYDLDTDRDQVNNYRWTVFVNVRIKDEDGNLLGVCGVGVFMDELQELVAAAEKEFDVKINLIDPDGMVQVDSSSSNIENAYISEAIADEPGADTFVYTKRGRNKYRMTRYMEDLDWYLVVQSFASKEKPRKRRNILLVLTYLFLAALIPLVFWEKKKAPLHFFERNDDAKDALTGLANRNYLATSFGELGIFNTTRYKSLVMFDIDHFKVENETKDGDGIIMGIAELTDKLVGGRGMLFRWSGDEFVVFYELSADEAEKQFRTFCKEVKDSFAVTISVGIVAINLSESIKTNYHRAVELCYEVKIQGGNGVKKGL